MAMNYYTFVQRFVEHTGMMKRDFNATIIIPSAIDYAEQRIYRDVDLTATYITDATGTTSSGVRTFTLPTGIGTFITVDTVNVFTPAGAGTSSGIRVPLVPASRDFVDGAFPTALSSLCATPEYFALRNNAILTFGPCPDAGYTVEVVGTQRPTSLTSANSSTILTQYVPDLFLAAALVYAAEYLKKEDRAPPVSMSEMQLSMSWENQYQMLMRTAAVEQFRAKFNSEGWTSKQPNPVATPKRA